MFQFLIWPPSLAIHVKPRENYWHNCFTHGFWNNFFLNYINSKLTSLVRNTLMLFPSRETINTNLIVFGLTWALIEHTIYHTWRANANLHHWGRKESKCHLETIYALFLLCCCFLIRDLKWSTTFEVNTLIITPLR